MTEVGRTMIVREQLQTASDSAALAAANSGTHRFVRLEVTTDMGSEEHCGGDPETCTCVECPTVTVPVPPGDEKELIDEEGWKDYCVDPCDCGGGDCYFTIKDRWVQYDITAGTRSLNPTQKADLRNKLTDAAKIIIGAKGYPYTEKAKNVVAGLSLEEISTLLSNNQWASRYFAFNAPGYCQGMYIDSESPYECRQSVDEANFTAAKVATRSQWITNQVNLLTAINTPSQQSAVTMSADDAADDFFQANLPKHAEESVINQVDVYNYDQRSSPYYPSTVVHAKAKIKSLFPSLFGTDAYNTDICAQGSTYYKSLQDEGDRGRNESARWSKAPEDACWQEP